jgi:hypothetical protein
MDKKEEKNWPLVRAKLGCLAGKDAVEGKKMVGPSSIRNIEYAIYMLFAVVEDIVDYLDQKESKNGRN